MPATLLLSSSALRAGSPESSSGSPEQNGSYGRSFSAGPSAQLRARQALQQGKAALPSSSRRFSAVFDELHGPDDVPDMTGSCLASGSGYASQC